MLYEWYEMQHAAVAPLRVMADASKWVFSWPYSPLAHNPASHRVAAGTEVFSRVTRRYDKPEWGLRETHIDGQPVAIREQVVEHLPFCRLVHFAREGVQRDDPVVLLVAPLSGHYATLLRDTVRALLPEHEVYVTDWEDARMVPLSHGHFHFADYVDYLIGFMRLLGPQTHVVSVCQPTVPVLCAVSLMAADNDPDQPRSMTLMGGPIDTRVHPTEVNLYAKAHRLAWFEQNVIARVPARYPGFLRRVYPGFLQYAGFVSMNMGRHIDAHLDFFNHLIVGDGDSAQAHRKFYDEYNAVLDLDAHFYLETVQQVFQEHLLPRGLMEVRGKRVDPSAVRRTALLTIEGELDDISAPGQTEAAHGLCASLSASQRDHFLVPGVGHYGIFSGRRWREKIMPRVAGFIREHA